MIENTPTSPIIIDHRGTVKDVPVLSGTEPITEKKVKPIENPLEQVTEQLDSSLTALAKHYSQGERTNEEKAIKYLGYLDNTIQSFIAPLEKSGRITPEVFNEIMPVLGEKIKDVETYSQGKSSAYLDALTGLQSLLTSIQSSRLQKGMFSFTENSMNHIAQTIAKQRQQLEKIIADRPTTQSDEESHPSLDEGEIDFSNLPKDDRQPISLDELLG